MLAPRFPADGAHLRSQPSRPAMARSRRSGARSTAERVANAGRIRCRFSNARIAHFARARIAMNARVDRHGLKVAPTLDRFLMEEALPGTGIDPDAFWSGFSAIVREFTPRNRHLLAERDRLQTELDRWHRANPGPIRDMRAYRVFLEDIGYLVPVPGRVQATTANVDPEISEQAGPQLVVPVSNARYALNAANARWGSLYDALYGTDVIPDSGATAKGSGYSVERGKAVIARARAFLDASFPLARGSHADATSYAIRDGKLDVGLE